MDESVVQILAMLVAVLFWIVEMVVRYRQRRTRNGGGLGSGQGSAETSGGASQPAASAGSAPPATTSETPGAYSAAGGTGGGPVARAREAAGLVWRRKVRDGQARERRQRESDLVDGLSDLSVRLRWLQERGSPALAAAASFLSGRLSEVEGQLDPGASGSELERLSEALGVLTSATQALDLLFDARRGEQGRWLRLSDRLLKDIVDEIAALDSGPALALRPAEASWHSVLVDAGLAPLVMPGPWTESVTRWPLAAETVLRALVQSSDLGREIFDRVGLGETWVVPYSEPAYLSSAQVVGIYGPWLAALSADILALILWGPTWARMVTWRLSADNAAAPTRVRARSSGIHIDREPPAYLRLWALASVLDRLGLGEDADWVRATVTRWAEPDQALLQLPTRRGIEYAVQMKPFLDAGKALVEFLWDEPFPALGERSLADLLDSGRWARQASLARELRRGALKAPRDNVLSLLGAGMEAFAEADFDARAALDLASRALRNVLDQRVLSLEGRAEAALAGAATEGITQDRVVEALLLGTILGRPIWASRPGRAGPWPVRPVQELGRGRGRL